MRSQLRRLFAIFGLMLLGPIGYLLATDQLTAKDAGIRAGILFAGVVGARMLARMAPDRVEVSRRP